MAKKQELYVSFKKNEYKTGKSDVLECQADLLKIMRYFENLRRIKIEKNRLKIQMANILNEIKLEIDEINKKFPDIKIPGEAKRKTEEIKDWGIEESHSERYREIDAELREIQEKLKGLNF